MLPYKQFYSISIGPASIFVWGLFFALALLTGIYLTTWLADRKKLSKEHVYNLSFIIILGAVIGGRLGYVFTNLDQFGAFLDLFKTWQGGMSFHGGFFGGLLLSYIYMRWKKIDIWVYMDLFSPAIILGYSITRIGCYLSAAHIGAVTTVPWAIYYSGALRHPVAAYHFIAGMFIFGLLMYAEKKKKILGVHYFKGMSFALLVFIYGFLRFFIEFFREESFVYGLHLAQWVSIAMVIAGIAMLYFLNPSGIRKKKEKQ